VHVRIDELGLVVISKLINTLNNMSKQAKQVDTILASIMVSFSRALKMRKALYKCLFWVPIFCMLFAFRFAHGAHKGLHTYFALQRKQRPRSDAIFLNLCKQLNGGKRQLLKMVSIDPLKILGYGEVIMHSKGNTLSRRRSQNRTHTWGRRKDPR
jgi:hypothetical protein